MQGDVERQTEESQATFREVLRCAPWGIHTYELRPDGVLVFTGANEAADRILQVTHSQFVGRSIEDAFPPLLATEIPERYRAVAAERRVWHADVPYDFAGIRGLFEVYAFPTEPRRMAAMFQDVTERRRATLQLADSESLYRNLVENSPDGIFRADPQGDLIFVNERWSDISGYPSEAALGRGWFRAIHPDDRERVEAEWYAAARQGKPLRLDFRFLSAAGRTAWIAGTSVPVRSNGLVGFIGAFVDETERRRLATQSERLFSFSIDMLCVAGLDGYLKQVNPAWSKTLGWTAEELTSRPWLEFVHADDRPRTVVAREQLARGDVLRFFEHRYRCRDGRYRRLSWNAFPLPEERLIFAIVRDITDRHEAERQLRLVESSIQRSAEPTFWLRADGRVHFVNDAACHLLDYSREELGQMSVWDVDPALSPELWAARRQEVARAAPLVFETTHRRKDGRLLPVEVLADRIEFEGEQLFFAFVRDISQRRHDEQQRLELLAREQAAREAAQEANRAKDHFLAVLSHELRNPLAPILASVELLQRSVRGDDARAQRALEILRRNTELEARLLDDLLDLSRVVRGRVSMRRTRVSLDEVVRRAAEQFHAVAAKARLTFSVDAAPGLWVEADADRLQQVVMNLLSNAFKFTAAGGSIRVTMDSVDGRGRIAVADSGIGIEPARLPTLFDAMFQHGDAGMGHKPGLGIGLALVKSLVEMHGGRVWAESGGLGCGSRFSVELPLTAAPEVEAAQPRRRSPEDSRPLDVLLVEDNPDTREMLAETLQLLAYRVRAAASGEEALGLLAAFRPDVILADIGLPGIDGYEFLRRARQLPDPSHAPAFALTGFGQPKDVERGRTAGFIEHLVKPVDIERLDRHIRALVDAESMRGAT
jgi:PAS domain S-box-containing protein